LLTPSHNKTAVPEAEPFKTVVTPLLTDFAVLTNVAKDAPVSATILQLWPP
jgi:hypothetical protein